MKSFLLYLVCVLSGCSIYAQKDLEKETIRILANSELVISGSTNVNKFDCKFNIELIGDPRDVRYTREEDQLNFSNLQLHLLTEGFDCGNKRMNADFQELLMCERYPEIKIRIDQIQLISKAYAKAYIQVELAGKTKHYDFPVELNTKRYTGKFRMNIRDFGLEPPKKALGLIEVDEQIEVQFNLRVGI